MSRTDNYRQQHIRHPIDADHRRPCAIPSRSTCWCRSNIAIITATVTDMRMITVYGISVAGRILGTPCR
jgi:hypothetical protein